jgi:hypothetical protein
VTCPDSCPDEWEEASDCDATCGPSYRRDTRVLDPDVAVDSNCATERVVECNSPNCPVECVLHEWQKDGECSAQCGGGKQVYVKGVKREGKYGGDPCPTADSAARWKQVDCNVNGCPERKIAVLQIKAFVSSGATAELTQLHAHRIIHNVAQFIGLPTSSVVLEYDGVGRRLRDKLTITLKIRTDEVVDANSVAVKILEDVTTSIESGELLEELRLSGIFSWVDSFQVGESYVEADTGEWAGEVIKALAPPAKKEDTEFEDEQELQEYLPDSMVVSINFVIGVEAIDRHMRSISFPDGEPVYRGTDFSTREAQEHLVRLCDFKSPALMEAIGEAARKELRIREVRCFLPQFTDWLRSEGMPAYPLSRGQDFPRLLRNWMDQSAGKKWKGFAGFIDGDLKWVRVMVISDMPKETAAAKLLVMKDAYEEIVAFRNDQAPSNDLIAFQTSYDWVRAVTEDGIISSTFWCAIISIGCALLVILAFTGSAVLALSVSGTVLMIVCVQAATMFVLLQWQFGAIEAIGMILFVGFSVDYTLHVAEAFHQAPPPKVENAMKRVGRPICSAAATTAGSAFFLFFCTIQVFFKFGLAIILNSAWSVLFALLFFPALLAVLPARYHDAAYQATADTEHRPSAGPAYPTSNIGRNTYPLEDDELSCKSDDKDMWNNETGSESTGVPSSYVPPSVPPSGSGLSVGPPNEQRQRLDEAKRRASERASYDYDMELEPM